jgi:hypothetical protein
LGISSLCFIYTRTDSAATFYQIFQTSDGIKAFWVTDKKLNDLFSGTQKVLKSASPFTRSIDNSIFQTHRDIRVLRVETLRNIIIDDEVDCSKRQFLIYKCSRGLCGGWGDREKGIVSSFLLALLTNRTFAIYMDKPCELENFMDPFIYNWTKCKRYLDTIPAQNTTEENHVGGNRGFYGKISSIDFEKLWTRKKIVLFLNAYVPVMDSIKLHKDVEKQMKWIVNMTRPEIVHLVIHTLFRPKQRLRNELAEFIRTNTNGRHLVCSHIRIGKNPSIPGDNNLPKGSPKEGTIFSFLKRFKNPRKYAIYIATDSNDVRQGAMNNFKNVFNINRTIVHVDRFKKVDRETDICEGLYTVLFEQLMLSFCDTLLITRSNFGTIAAYMRGSSDDLYLYHTKTDKVFLTNITNIQSVYGFV